MRTDWSGSFGAFCAALRPKQNIEPRYLSAFLQSPAYWKQVGKKALGVNINNLRRGDIETLSLPLPPLEQQRLIIAEIEKQFSRLDEAVANLKRVKANLKRYKAAVLKAAVEGRLVPTEAELARKEGREYETGEQLLKRILETRRNEWNGKGKYSEPAALDSAELSALPVGWIWASAEQLCSVVASGSTPSPDLMMADKGDVPFLKVYNLTFGESLDFSIKPTFVRQETHEGQLARSRTLPGDVLMNIVGPPLGKVSIANDLHPEWNINQAIVTFRSLPGFDNRLLASWLLSEPILRRLLKTSKATAGQSNLQVSTCRKIALPLPSVREQSRIVSELESKLSLIRGLSQLADTSLAKAERLRSSILAAAFLGQPDGEIENAN